jgi:hypothetical protein
MNITLSQTDGEEWYIIEDFPNYEVSSTGLVLNSNTDRVMKTSKTLTGVVKVGLMGFDGKQHTRSVKVLVAEAFVGGCDDINNTPIHLDLDQNNCRADNLVWRPRWYTGRYARQFQNVPRSFLNEPIVEETTNTQYASIYEAAITLGLLMGSIVEALHNGAPCFPTHYRFRYVSESLQRK